MYDVGQNLPRSIGEVSMTDFTWVKLPAQRIDCRSVKR